jgi:hypothetical protein
MRSASLLLIAAAALPAQNGLRIEVVADATRVECGRTFKVRAIAFGPDNKPVSAQFQYSTNLGSRAPVAADGTVTALAAGVIRVRAALTANFSNEIAVQAVPARMEITPASAAMTMGERRTFAFKAFDVNGREIPTPTVNWSVLHGNGFNSVAASVNAQGVVTALAESDLSLRAGFDYDPYLPGFQRQSYTTIPLRIRPRESYRLRKIPLPEENPGGLFRGPRMVDIAPNESGQFLQVAPISAGNVASLLWDGERYRPVLATGREGSQPSSPIGEIYGNALNDRGEVVIHALNTTGGYATSLFRGTFDSQSVVLADNTPIGSYGLAMGSYSLSRFALNNDGHLLLLLNYASRSSAPTRQGLFRIETDGSVYLVADAFTPLPGLDSPVRFDGNFYGTPSGRDSWFLASSGSNMALYRRRGFEPIERVLGTGDELQGSRIRAILAGPYGWIARSGDIVATVQLDNGQTWLGFLPGGDLSAAAWTRLGSWQRTCGSRPDGRVWIYGAPLSQPVGLYMLQGASFTRHMSENATRLEGEAIAGGFGCFVDAQDRPHALLSTASNYFILTRFEGTEPVILSKGGDPVDGQLRPFFTGFIQGKREGDVYLAGGAWASHIWRLNGSSLEPFLIPGNLLRSGTWFAGGNLAVNDSGQLVTTASNRYDTLRRSEGAEAELVMANGHTLADGTRLWGGYGARINNRGSMLTQLGTSRGDTRLVLNRGNGPETILSNGAWQDLSFTIEGLGAASSWGDYALDDADRVLALISTREGKSAWCLWEDGAWRVAFEQTASAGHRAVTGYHNLRAAGESFILRFSTIGGMAGIAIFDRAGPRILIDPEDPGPNGNLFGFTAQFQFNNRGEAVFWSNSFGTQVLGVQRNGAMRHIYSQTSATRDGDVLYRVQDLIIMNDGRVYVLAMTPFETQVLYEATPLD